VIVIPRLKVIELDDAVVLGRRLSKAYYGLLQGVRLHPCFEALDMLAKARVERARLCVVDDALAYDMRVGLLPREGDDGRVLAPGPLAEHDLLQGVRGERGRVRDVRADVEEDADRGVDLPRHQVVEPAVRLGGLEGPLGLEELDVLARGVERGVGLHGVQDRGAIGAEGGVGVRDGLRGVLEEAKGLERVEHELRHLRGQADAPDGLDQLLEAGEGRVVRDGPGVVAGWAGERGGREPQAALGLDEVVLERREGPARARGAIKIAGGRGGGEMTAQPKVMWADMDDESWEVVVTVPEPRLPPEQCPFRMLGVKQGKGRKAVLRAWRRRVHNAGADGALIVRLGEARDRILASVVDCAEGRDT
jgi:hypothetical protein